MCQGGVPGSLACLLSCLPSYSPLVQLFASGEPTCAGGVPGSLACLPICFPSSVPLVLSSTAGGTGVCRKIVPGPWRVF